VSAGVIWRLVYEQEPKPGLLNATITAITDVFRPPGPYPTAAPRDQQEILEQNGAVALKGGLTPGSVVAFPLVAIPRSAIPADAVQAVKPPPASGAISGTVWLDFAPGGGGSPGVIDPGEVGLPGISIEVVAGGNTAGSATSGPDGTFVISGLDPGTSYQVVLPASNFRSSFNGYAWLGPTLVTPAVIVSYIWIWAGFAMVLIAAGLAAIPRDVLEAARVDGANEWQVFRRVTVPLLTPVLLVVLVTLVINVLKVFDLVLVIPPESSQYYANVIALEMWRVSFGGGLNQGLGSALAVFLFVLVIPAMAFNLRRFRAEG
jgi:alpha-glucoside transport system permease protein